MSSILDRKRVIRIAIDVSVVSDSPVEAVADMLEAMVNHIKSCDEPDHELEMLGPELFGQFDVYEDSPESNQNLH